MTRVRGFEHIKGFENKVELPVRGTSKSSGYDFHLPENLVIRPGEVQLIPSGIKSYMMDDEELLLSIRSKWGAKKQIILLAHKIDADYYGNPDNDGHIFIAIKNTGQAMFELLKGERICQGTFYKYLTADNDLSINSSREGGFGSTNQ